MQRPRVLLADDYPGILAVLRALLEPGYEVVEAVMDGESLVRAAVEHHPDFIIADIDMPRMSGLEAARQVARLVPDSRVLLHSSYDDPAVRAEGFAAGAVSYVVKGQPAQLLACLRALAGTPRPARGRVQPGSTSLPQGADAEGQDGRSSSQRIAAGH